MEHYYETIIATLETSVHFDFEGLLRKHFGLKGEYNSPAYKRAVAIADEEERGEAFDAILEKKGPEGFYTKEAWDAWQRAIDLIEGLRDAGLINDDICNHICHRFCDNA